MILMCFISFGPLSFLLEYFFFLQNNALTSKTLAWKLVASKKRPSVAGDQPLPKQSKGFIAKKKTDRSSAQ